MKLIIYIIYLFILFYFILFYLAKAIKIMEEEGIINLC